ncbi:MAG: mechanosensitive ion channel family protein [Dehalococcoidia bacterium]|nr:mechanosensitive ion channel family protein [Dehalococcoidia bacterium]
MDIPFLVPSSWDEWKGWFRDDLPQLAGIILALVILNLVFRRFLTRLIRRGITRAGAVRGEDQRTVERRTGTLLATINWIFTSFLLFIGLSLVLDNIGMNVSALVASVGIAGLALGLGAQTLIKDVINGTFILLEDQFGVGDSVQVAGVSGQVIEVNPRRTVLRDMNGHVHYVPNSAIQVATNMTQGFSRINLDITVPREIDSERAIEMVNGVCADYQAERQADFLTQPKVLRIEALTEGGLILKVTADVKAGTQWELTGELRRRVKARFDAEGADILQPLRPIVLREMSDRPDPSGGTKTGTEPPAPAPPPTNPLTGG